MHLPLPRLTASTNKEWLRFERTSSRRLIEAMQLHRLLHDLCHAWKAESRVAASTASGEREPERSGGSERALDAGVRAGHRLYHRYSSAVRVASRLSESGYTDIPARTG